MGFRLQAPGSSSVTKICGACLLFSGVLGLGLPAFGSSIGYPIFADFGDAALLQHFASIWPRPLWFAVLAAMVPTLTLCSGLGFFYMLKHDGAIALLAIGDAGATAMSVFAGGFGMVGYVGMLLINWVVFKRGGLWRLVAGIGLFSAVAIIIASTLSPLFPFAQAGFPIGFILLRIWMIVMGVMMIRWKPANA